MPNLIGGIILGYIWQLLLNGVLAHWGKTLTYSGTYGLMGMIILVCWQQIGYMMIIYISGIQNIPGELIEAAKIDGANSRQVLRKVIIPMVMPSITICTFLTLTNGFKLFDQNLALTNGAPSKMSELLALNIFNTFYGRAGYEGAPLVSARFWSNNLNPFVNVKNVQIVIDGITIGIMTLRSTCRELAPSIFAASISSPGIF
jgi:raffinose/stachyose/melibiose transport system permease protein